jgi:ParB-like chromosome segregation protein Spo0J
MPAEWLETRDIPLAELTRFPGNARRGNVNVIRESLRRNGQYRALVVRYGDDSLVILAGNHTFDALAAEGRETARCEVIRCTDDESRRINLVDNRANDLAVDDSDALVELLSYLDGDYEGTGFTEEQVDKLIEPGAPTGDADVDDLPKAYGVIIECESEEQQAALLGEFDGRGLRVKALMA